MLLFAHNNIATHKYYSVQCFLKASRLKVENCEYSWFYEAIRGEHQVSHLDIHLIFTNAFPFKNNIQKKLLGGVVKCQRSQKMYRRWRHAQRYQITQPTCSTLAKSAKNTHLSSCFDTSQEGEMKPKNRKNILKVRQIWGGGGINARTLNATFLSPCGEAPRQPRLLSPGDQHRRLRPRKETPVRLVSEGTKRNGPRKPPTPLPFASTPIC